MKKHLFGLALFSLIVGTAMFVAALVRTVPQPAKTYTYEVSKTSCWKYTRQNSEIRKNYDNDQTAVKITQAVLNERTNDLDMDFFIQRETPSTQSVKIKLTFVNGLSKGSGNWDGVVRTEYATLAPNFNVENKAVYSLPLSYNWLNKLRDGENLYVMAEIDNGRSNNLENVARSIDFNDFTPVLLVNKK